MSYPRIDSSEMPSAKYVNHLLEKSIAKQSFHARMRLHADRMDSSKTPLFNDVLKKIQTFVDERIDKLGTIQEEMDRLKSPAAIYEDIHDSKILISFLKGDNEFRSGLYQLCDILTQNVHKDLKKLASSKLQVPEYHQAQNAILSKYEMAIAQIVFLSDVLPDKTAQCIDHKDIETSIKSIERLFDEQMSRTLIALETEWQAHKKTGLQDPESVMRVKVPLAIAKMLLTTDGQINAGLIDLVKSYFFSKERDLLAWETWTIRVLDQIGFSWQAHFDEIKKPQSLDSPSHDLIRAQLGLDIDEEISDLHAKQLALATLLSAHGPGPIGCCFAVAWEIKNAQEFLQNSLHDYALIAEKGYLPRLIDGHREHFFFKTTISDPDLSRTVKLNSKGELSAGTYIWDCPSLLAACSQMGIDMKKYAPDVLTFLFRDKTSLMEITPEQILGTYAEVHSKRDGKLPKDFYLAKGKYAFSQTTNRMLLACENMFASMAETRKEGRLRRNIQTCVRNALKNQWDSSKEDYSLKTLDLIGKVEQCFYQSLDKCIRFVYNPALSPQQIPGDERSMSGGFELYGKDPLASSTIGYRIATPNDFSKLISTVIELTEKTLSDSNFSDTINIYQIGERIRKYVASSRFVVDVIQNFDEANKTCNDPLSQYTHLIRTPMTIRDKDKPYEVEALDTGLTFLPAVKTIPPKNPYSLIKWLYDLTKWKERVKYYLGSSAQSILTDFIKSGLSSDEWFKEKIISLGEEIANSHITDQTKRTFHQKTLDWLRSHFPDKCTPEVLQKYENFYQSFSKKIISVETYAQSMLDCLNFLFKTSPYESGKLSLAIDDILIHCMPKHICAQLQSMAIRFAKNEWDDWYCVYFNLRTKELGFARIDEQHTQLHPIDEYDWIGNERWTNIPL